jgi:hypothetical protein
MWVVSMVSMATSYNTSGAKWRKGKVEYRVLMAMYLPCCTAIWLHLWKWLRWSGYLTLFFPFIYMYLSPTTFSYGFLAIFGQKKRAGAYRAIAKTIEAVSFLWYLLRTSLWNILLELWMLGWLFLLSMTIFTLFKIRSLTKYCNSCVSPRPATSCDSRICRVLEDGCKWSFIHGFHHVSAKKS